MGFLGEDLPLYSRAGWPSWIPGSRQATSLHRTGHAYTVCILSVQPTLFAEEGSVGYKLNVVDLLTGVGDGVLVLSAPRPNLELSPAS